MSTAGPGVVPTSPAAPSRPTDTTVSVAAGLAAAVLAGTSTGSMVVAALLVGLAARDRRSAGAALLAVAATAIRFRTATFDDLAGIQSVLGAAGTVGPRTAAASAWAAAVAVVLATRSPAPPGGRHRPGRAVAVRSALPLLAPAFACGLLAAAVVAGPGPSDLDVRVGASLAGVAVAAMVGLVATRPAVGRALPWVALAAGAAAVVLAGWPS